MPQSEVEYGAVIRIPPDSVEDAHDFLIDVWESHPDVNAGDRMAVETVLSELVTNVIQNNAGTNLVCEITVAVSPLHVRIESIDTGIEVRELPEENAMPDQDAESGRGLSLMHVLSDSVEYRRESGRNIWTVIRTRDSAASL